MQPLRETRATGDTSLYDAVALAIPLVRDGYNLKKSLLVVSDGVETKSLSSLHDVQLAIGKNDVRGERLNVDTTAVKNGQRHSIAVEVRGRRHAASARRGFVAD